MAMGSSHRTLIPEFRRVTEQLKYEVAHELGVQAPPDGYWGDLPSRQCGAVGGHIVRRLIQIAEQEMMGRRGMMR